MAGLAGNRQAATASMVQPDALTDEELDNPSPRRAPPPVRTAPRADTFGVSRQLQSLVRTHPSTTCLLAPPVTIMPCVVKVRDVLCVCSGYVLTIPLKPCF